MSGRQFDNSDYNDIVARLKDLHAKFPDGRLRPLDPANPYRIEVLEDRHFIVYTALCYRTPDDPLPGVGCAWEPWPGKTPFTFDSELQNAETSAWCRAIVATLATLPKRVATDEDIRNRQNGHPESNEGQSPPEPPTVSPHKHGQLKARLIALGRPPDAWKKAKLPLNPQNVRVEDLPLAERILDAAEAKVRKQRAQEVSLEGAATRKGAGDAGTTETAPSASGVNTPSTPVDSEARRKQRAQEVEGAPDREDGGQHFPVATPSTPSGEHAAPAASPTAPAGAAPTPVEGQG